MLLRIVPPYAAALAILYLLLSFYVVRERGRHAVPLGDGGVAALQRRVRVHANFAEYAPFTLVLLVMAELRGVAPLALHGLCLGLLAGRMLHAWGVSQAVENVRFRMVGMILTFAALGGSALALLLG